MAEPPKSYRDVALRLGDVTTQLAQIHARFAYSTNDARGHAVKEARMITNATLAIVLILSAGEEKRIPFGRLIGIIDGTPQVASDAIDQFTRASYVTLFQFKIETLFANLLMALGMGNPPQGFYRITNELMLRVSVNNDGRAKEILQVPAFIRNSLHSNGYHHGYQGTSTTVQLDAEKFEFIDGQRVECAGWRHIILAIVSVLGVVEELLDTPEIRGLKDPIEDQYVGDY